MTPIFDRILRQHCRPLSPRPTQAAEVLRPLADIRCVLFDVYGTLIISASGDVGTSTSDVQASAFRDALIAMGIRIDQLPDPRTPQRAVDELRAAIARRHQVARNEGVDYPEVDIAELWRQSLEVLVSEGALPAACRGLDSQQLAVEYEARTNPTWPMPGLLECLQSLRSRQLTLGIVSNAQFFTPRLFPALVESSLEELGFATDLQFFSYQHGRAKPGQHLYRLAAESCQQRGIAPHQVLYAGNDMLNDIQPAQAVGFRTALFAGDARSLRMRARDDRVAGVEPDLILLQLSSLPDCIA